GDGKPDLVVANDIGGTVSVLLGNSDGSFQAQQTFATGRYPRSVAVADVNGDGRPDLVVANANSFGSTVSVLLGKGDGSFQGRNIFAAGSSPSSAAVADVNGDGRSDLIVANRGDSTVSVFLARGDGSFQDQRTFATGRYPSSVAVA